MNVHQILAALLALGPKLPQVMAHIEAIVAEVTALVTLVKGEQPMFGACEMDAGEAALCEQAEAELAAEGAFAGPGDRIKNLLAFLKEHPELLQFVLTLLK